MTGAFLLGLVAGASLTWVFIPSRDRYWREFNARPRGSNPPPPGRKPPEPPAPPYSSAAIAWQAEEAQRIYRGGMWREKGSEAWHPMGVPWDEAHTQRGNGHGGPSTPKPEIKPQPSGGTPNPPPEAP